jgi:hypothetical protein
VIADIVNSGGAEVANLNVEVGTMSDCI